MCKIDQKSHNFTLLGLTVNIVPYTNLNTYQNILTHCRAKKYQEKQRGIQNLDEKRRLLENIYCHRRLNSFFNIYKKSKFRKEHSEITSNILNKIDLLQIVNQHQGDPLASDNS